MTLWRVPIRIVILSSACILGQQLPKSRWILTHSHTILTCNYTSRIQVKDIAERVDLHPNYASTLFREAFGTTLNALIIRHRVAHAQRQLITTAEQILPIALDSGSDSLSRFNRAFKQLVGMTPSQYRKRRRPVDG